MPCAVADATNELKPASCAHNVLHFIVLFRIQLHRVFRHDRRYKLWTLADFTQSITDNRNRLAVFVFFFKSSFSDVYFFSSFCASIFSMQQQQVLKTFSIQIECKLFNCIGYWKTFYLFWMHQCMCVCVCIVFSRELGNCRPCNLPSDLLSYLNRKKINNCSSASAESKRWYLHRSRKKSKSVRKPPASLYKSSPFGDVYRSYQFTFVILCFLQRKI